jgi:quinoprotein glucose dehydrogenase
MTRWRGYAAVAGVALLGAGFAPRVTNGTKPYTTWSDYAGSADSMQYSALRQITKANVARLELAWFYPAPGPSAAFNPLIVDGAMYVLGPQRAIVALDAASGREIWSHPVEGNPATRGINYWESRDRSDRRLIYTGGHYLQEINAKTGVTINTFGNDGRVDLREGLGRDPRSVRSIQSKNPGRVFENLIILGSAPGEGFGSAPGDIRAWDVITGKLAWTFHTIPRPGEFGYDTWPAEAYKYGGGANNWGEMTLDEPRGILYVPLGSPTADLYGADRKGANLYGNCLVALDARTGKRLWHFQTVHHDLWDYDLTTAPKLLTVRHNGRKVDVVAQAAKHGYLFVFDRVTGKPLWPIEERPVAKSEVPGEHSWPTQPIPTKPPPFSRIAFGEQEINPYLPEPERAELRETLKHAHNAGVFTPSSHRRNHIQIPGAFGGANWGAAAVDPTTGMLYIRGYDAPSIRQLSEYTPVRVPEGGTAAQRGFALYMQMCAGCHTPARAMMKPPKELGVETFVRTVRSGRGQMPAFEEEGLSDDELKSVAAYLDDPAAGEAGVTLNTRGDRGGDREGAPRPQRPAGLRQFSGPFGAQWLSKDGLPVIGPPWSELVAYDLNAGTIKWRVPAGNLPALVVKGITGTGSYRPRTGPVVTAGGVIFLATGGDQTLRAYDKDSGQVLWEKQLDANPDGIPAVYEVNGRQYVVFCVAGDKGGGSRTPANFKPGNPAAQGYYAFALPSREVR